MPGPAPTYQPTFTAEQVQACQRLVRQHNAPHAQVARARLALLLHEQPGLDSGAAARQLGKHPNWAYTWRRRWATAGWQLTDQPGRGRQPAVSPVAAEGASGGRW
jgi:transposase